MTLEAALVARLRANRIHIPPYPAVATKLQSLVSQGRSTDDLAAVAANDPALVAVVLAHASSAVQRAGAAVSLPAAINRIGVEELVRLAIAESLGAVASAPGPLATLRRDTWRCALLSARLCHDLAQRRGIATGEAYLAGLLHDFGAIAVVAGLEEMSKETALPVLAEPIWRALVSRLHLQFGTVIATRWKLPAPIAAVISSYGQPPELARTPLVQLVQLVDRVIAVLDRAPATGIAALLEVSELSTDERYAIGTALPEVVAQMATYTATKATAAAASSVEPRRNEEEAWPIAFDVVQSQATFQTRTISPNTFEMVGKTPLLPNWLADMVLHCATEPVQMLVNVKTCEPQPDGTYVIVAAPFALGGAVKQQWMSLIERARVQLEDVA